EQSAFAFELVESKLSIAWQDMVMRYRMGMFYTGIVLTQSQWAAEVPPVDEAGEATGDVQEFFTLEASGYGGNVGVQIPLSSRSMIYTDILYSMTPTVQQGARAADVPEDVPAPEE